uniref:Non-structural replication polyprotein n=1 Tax=Watercress white vein virus TaxID=1111988 RepID=M4GQ26_9VIRU|nr:RNA polymerase [Watercress white vein virus]
MAFQLALDALAPTTHRDPSLHPILESTVDSIRSSITTYPWAVPKLLLPLLNSYGIPTSGLGTSHHPHAAHKTIETFLLHIHWSFQATTPSSVMFMKPSKFHKLASVNPNFKELKNYRLHPNDSTRYPTTSPDLPSHPTVFMHDALMYYHPSQILHLFQAKPNLEKLYASLVVPPEALLSDHSFYPQLYRYSTTRNTLHYVPEGHEAGSYNQPADALSWLRINELSLDDLHLSVTILESWGPVHSLLIQRGVPHPDPALLSPLPLTGHDLFSSYHQPRIDLVSFRTPDAVALPEATFLDQPLRHRLVPRTVYNALFTYTRAVRTLRTSDPAAFVRMHSSKPEHDWVTPTAWDNLQTFALLNVPLRPNVVYHVLQSPLAALKLYLKQHWRRLAATAAPILSSLTLLQHFLPLSLPLPEVKSICLFHKEVYRKRELLPSFHPFQVCPPLRTFFQETLRVKPNCRPGSPQHFLLQRVLNSLRPLAPLLAMTPLYSRKPKPLLPHAELSWTLKSFALPWQASLALLAISELSILVHKMTSPPALQAQHDIYHRHMHPGSYVLQWERTPLRLSRSTAFLPFTPTISTAPLASSQAITAPLFSNMNARPLPPSTHPSRPPAPTTTEVLQTQTESPPNHSLPDQPFTTPPSLSPTAHPPTSPHPPPPHPSSDDAPLRPDPLAMFPELIPASNPSSSRPAVPPGTHPAPPTAPTTAARSIPPALLPPPLPSDHTAVGPVLPFHQLHPRNYPPNTADYHTRLRVLPPSPLPHPILNCLLTAVSLQTNVSEEHLWHSLQTILPDSQLDNDEVRTFGLSTDHLTALAHLYNFQARVHSDHGQLLFGPHDSAQRINITHTVGPHPTSPPALDSSAVPRPNPPEPSHPLVRAMKSFKVSDHYLPFLEAHRHPTSISHAKNLVSNMKNGFDGVLSLIDVSSNPRPGHTPRERIIELDRHLDTNPEKTVPLVHIAGFAGCGKTHPIQKLLQSKLFKDFRVSCPTTELRNEWKSSMSLPGNQSWRFCTWESSLLKSSKILVIDEIYKMPRGYLDLSILSDPAVELVIILGDPLQGEYHSLSKDSSNHRLPSETIRLVDYIDAYCWWSYRIPQVIARLFSITSFNYDTGIIGSIPTPVDCHPILTNSHAAALTFNNLGYRACTISSSQGITLSDPAVIVLDNYTRYLSASNGLVALTRSRTGVQFMGPTTYIGGTNGSSAMFSDAVNRTPINLDQYFPSLFHRLPLIHSPIQSRLLRLTGATPSSSPTFRSTNFHLPPHVPLSYSSDFVALNPSLDPKVLDSRLETHFLPPSRLPLHFDLESPSLPPPAPSKPEPTLPKATACYPGENFESLAAFFLPAHDPAQREILYRDQSSNQFPWFDRPFSLSCQPSSLISAKHSPASDPTLLPASINKRLRFRPSEAPHAITSDDVILGLQLFHSLCRAYNRQPSQSIPFNPELFADCISLNEYAQLSSKTQATIVANASRSDPDWRHTTVKIFAKAQHKVNDGSIFGPWKACQTLALMHDFVILVLGPVKKYQRIFDNSDRPEHIYSHCGKTPIQLRDWCQQHLTSFTPKVANDYTAFDQSQHGESVVLEALKMKRLNIPAHLIELHVHLKTNVSTQFGPLTCMRLTGEPGTYDDNTDYNLAVIFSQYEVGSCPIMVSGDDSLIDRVLPTRSDWPDVLKRLHLKFKLEHTTNPLFCGYYVGPAGCLRNPLALFCKLMIAVDDDALPDRRLSYLTEFTTGHRLGEPLWSLLPSELVKYQSACFDFFCRHCPKHEKMLLSDEPPTASLLDRVTSSPRWLTKNAMYLLPAKLRLAISSLSQVQSFPESPEVSQVESELLHYLQ